MGVSRAHRCARVHPADRAGSLHRRLHRQPRVERFPGHPRPCLRPALRTRLPAPARRGQAGRDLPPQARRRGPARRHHAAPAEGAIEEERQAHCLHRRGPGDAHRRKRPAADRLRGRDLRAVRDRRRPDAHEYSRLPPAGRRCSTRRSATSSTWARTCGSARRSPSMRELLAERRVRRRLRRHRRAERQGIEPAGPKRIRTGSTSASPGSSRSPSSTSTRSASAC